MSNRRQYALNPILIIVVLGILVGCATPYKTPVLDPADAEFDGIADLLQREAPVDVVSVHGMCTHDEDWVTKTTQRLDSNLAGLRIKDTRSTTVEGIKVYETTFANANGDIRLRNHALVWSALTEEGKKGLCYDSSGYEPSCQGAPELNKRKRGSINAALKTILMNDCLSDVVLYLGPSGETIRTAFRASIDHIVDSSGNDSTLVLISESLGSKILADSFVEEANGKFRRLEYFAPTERVFMAANQLPLIELSEDHGLRDEGSAWSVFLGQILTPRSDDSGGLAQVVAFTDPNDLLSYQLRDRNFPTANVIVSNDKTWLGLLERPDTAHRGYLDNEKVWDYIVCGHSAICDESN